MVLIPFTQYMLPNGRREAVTIDRPEYIANKALRIIDAGYSFECEVLTTGEVSVTITGKNCDVEIEVCENGPPLMGAIDRMIERFDFDTARRQDELAG